jgi:hypothetical protein
MIGMLWYDPETKPLEKKITEAAAYYKDKYNIVANMAVVNVDEMGQAPQGITLERSRSIMRNHVLIGIGIPKKEAENGV